MHTHVCIHVCIYGCMHAHMHMSQAQKLGYNRSVAAGVWWGKGNRTQMLADAQASWHDSTVHLQRFFPPKMQKQTTVKSFDDVTDVLLMYIRGRYKKETCMRPRGSVIHSFSVFIWFFWLVPWLGHLGSHRPSNSATSVPLEEWNYNQTGKCSLFVQPYILKVILGTLS